MKTKLYGGNKDLLESTDKEAILYGATPTGKTTACCLKVISFAEKYPGVRILITRISYTSLLKSTLETFERTAKEFGYCIGNKSDEENCIWKIGAVKPAKYRFPYAKTLVDGKNYEGRSEILISSVENARNCLSGTEFELIYVSEVNQITEDEWMFFSNRANGRRQLTPYTQVFGDCNPENKEHWILNKQWGSARLIKSEHKDNPVLWDEKENKLTSQAQEMINRLNISLNEVQRKRLVEGEWA